MGVPDASTAESARSANEVCPHCGGRGWVVETGDGAGRARPCSCRKQRRAVELLERCGVPERYRDCRLDNFVTAFAEGAARDQLAGAVSICRRWVDEFVEDDGRFTSSGLLFTGPPGTGKTHLAAAVLAELLSTYGVRARFVDFTTLVHDIQASFDPSSPLSKGRLVEPITRAEVLVLDELGAQKPTPFVADLLYLIINTRYSARLPTLYTTNYRLDGAETSSLDRGPDRAPSLAQRIPASLISRLYEMARPVPLDSVPDYRREIKMHQHRV